VLRGSQWGRWREEEDDEEGAEVLGRREEADTEERATWRATTNGRSEEEDEDDDADKGAVEEDDDDARGTASSATSENSLSWGPRTRTCGIQTQGGQQTCKKTKIVKVSQICIVIQQSDVKKDGGLTMHR